MLLQVGVKALIKNSSGKYLLIRRSVILGDEPDNLWDVPGGRIKPDEPLFKALRRELKEEIGVDIMPNPRLIAAQDIIVENKDLHVIRLTYRIDCDYESIRLSDEHSSYRWVAPTDFHSLMIDPYLKEVLTNLDS